MTDSDGDGLTNSQEDTLGTSRSNADTDGDGTNDGAEVGGNVNAPFDSDGDGTSNALESSIVDTDADGVLEPDRSCQRRMPAFRTRSSIVCLLTDSDGDGLTNAQEDTLGTSRGNSDTDGDGTTDGAEVGGNVNAPADTDGDGTPNVLESSVTDADGDGVSNQNDSANGNACVPNANSAACLAAGQRRRWPDQRAGRCARHRSQQPRLRRRRHQRRCRSGQQSRGPDRHRWRRHSRRLRSR